MQNKISKYLSYSIEVAFSLKNNLPIVALETAVLTHGLPFPANVQLSKDLEWEVREQGVIPATIGLLDGKVHIGLNSAQIETLGNPGNKVSKISRRDFGIALANKTMGGTTVAGTLIAARAAGIRVFATGGIGGVHRDAPFDVSADLPELGRSPLIVVCAGAKAILDLPATVEYLETSGVPIIGYQTDSFPAFFSRSSHLSVNKSVDTPEEVAEIAHAHWDFGMESAILVVTPPPAENALPYDEINQVIEKALAMAKEKHITGSKVTPFLLNQVNEMSAGTSMEANLALLRNNASLAAQIAKALSPLPYSHI